MSFLLFATASVLIYFAAKIVLRLFVSESTVQRGENSLMKGIDGFIKLLVVVLAGLVIYFFIVLPILVSYELRPAP
jgi:Na+/serine symporter